MKTVRLRPHLGILFVLVVGLPSAALVVMAVRSIAGEEAILEKRLERTLGAELDHVVTLVADAMEEAAAELGRAAPADTGARGQAALDAWKASSDLVGVPFLLTADDRLVEPARSRELDPDEQTFLYYNEEFLAGSVQTPVYLNVGVAYFQEILAAIAADAGGRAADATESALPAAGTADAAVAEAAGEGPRRSRRDRGGRDARGGCTGGRGRREGRRVEIVDRSAGAGHVDEGGAVRRGCPGRRRPDGGAARFVSRKLDRAAVSGSALGTGPGRPGPGGAESGEPVHSRTRTCASACSSSRERGRHARRAQRAAPVDGGRRRRPGRGQARQSGRAAVDLRHP